MHSLHDRQHESIVKDAPSQTLELRRLIPLHFVTRVKAYSIDSDKDFPMLHTYHHVC